MTAARRWLPWAGVTATATLFAAANLVAFRGSYVGASDDAFMLALTIGLLTFSVVGAVLVRTHPANSIGWLFCATGLLFGVMIFSQTYVENYILAEGESGGFGDFTLWISTWVGTIAYSLIAAFLLLLFPTGRLLSSRWRPALILTVGSVALLVVASMVARELDDYERLVNPYAIGGGAFQEILNGVRGVAWILYSISVLLAATSLIVRFRRSKGVERQQMKWMAFAASLLLVTQFSWFVSEDLARLLSGLVFMAMPIAVCVAILRYRLYDIDLIINRTLVYGALTAILGLVYFGLVVVLQQATSPLTPESDLAVAGSTLAVAALFRPARSRVQSFIDRRFYRHKYDAAQALEEFNARLRDEIDLESLRHELLGVVGDTMQPARASLWLRTPRHRL
jgi:hypothetical protein